MNKWLLTWNPEYTKWLDVDKDLDLISQGIKVNTRWSTGNTKSIAIGDEVFFLRQGTKPTGIFARGYATSEVLQGPKWDDDNKIANYAHFDIVDLIDPLSESVVEYSALNSSIPSGNWTPLASGSKIKIENWEILYAMWRNFYEK